MSKLSLLSDMSELTNIVYDIANGFCNSEKYNLTNQIKRAMVSTRLNIREGNVFTGKKKIQLFTIALGSLNEIDECIEIGLDIDEILEDDYKKYRKQYWLCLNKLKKLIQSINSNMEK